MNRLSWRVITEDEEWNENQTGIHNFEDDYVKCDNIGALKNLIIYFMQFNSIEEFEKTYDVRAVDLVGKWFYTMSNGRIFIFGASQQRIMDEEYQQEQT